MKRIKSMKYLMMAMVAVVCVTLSACGGDDEITDDKVVSVEYFEPCLLWGSSIEEVKTWMNGKPFELIQDGMVLFYGSEPKNMGVNYMFDLNISGLSYVDVEYEYSEKTLSWLISQTEKRYNTKLTKGVDQVEQYYGFATINGKTVGIMIVPGAGIIQVMFSV